VEREEEELLCVRRCGRVPGGETGGGERGHSPTLGRKRYTQTHRRGILALGDKIIWKSGRKGVVRGRRLACLRKIVLQGRCVKNVLKKRWDVGEGTVFLLFHDSSEKLTDKGTKRIGSVAGGTQTLWSMGVGGGGAGVGARVE